MANDGGHPLWGWDNNVSDHEMCTVYKDTTEKLFIMPRGGATAYGSHVVCLSATHITSFAED